MSNFNTALRNAINAKYRYQNDFVDALKDLGVNITDPIVSMWIRRGVVPRKEIWSQIEKLLGKPIIELVPQIVETV